MILSFNDQSNHYLLNWCLIDYGWKHWNFLPFSYHFPKLFVYWVRIKLIVCLGHSESHLICLQCFFIILGYLGWVHWTIEVMIITEKSLQNKKISKDKSKKLILVGTWMYLFFLYAGRRRAGSFNFFLCSTLFLGTNILKVCPALFVLMNRGGFEFNFSWSSGVEWIMACITDRFISKLFCYRNFKTIFILEALWLFTNLKTINWLQYEFIISKVYVCHWFW